MSTIRTVCFTGHRNAILTAELKGRLTSELERLIAAGATTFLSGAARGWDLICAAVVLDLKAIHPDVELWLILPCPADEQTKGWEKAEIAEYKRISEVADKVELCADRYYNGCMKVRNQRLVDLADYCVCYYNPSDWRSGTGQTVRMSERKNIKIVNMRMI